jgi:tRNA threonylcarbamoyladenosine biosynthesis protein TsaB
MTLLAIETSSQWTGVAVVEDGKVIAGRSLESRSSHNEVLAGLIEKVLGDAGRKINDVGLLAVSIGPGSFTALRIGLLTAKGIAFARRLRIVPVMTLDVLNASVGFEDEGLRIPLMDAYKGEVFAALYRGGTRLTEPVIIAPSKIADIAGPEGQVAVFGPGFGKYSSDIEAALGARLTGLDNHAAAPSAKALASLAWTRKENAVDPEALEPFYLRKPDARHPKDKINV